MEATVRRFEVEKERNLNLSQPHVFKSSKKKPETGKLSGVEVFHFHANFFVLNFCIFFLLSSNLGITRAKLFTRSINERSTEANILN